MEGFTFYEEMSWWHNCLGEIVEESFCSITDSLIYKSISHNHLWPENVIWSSEGEKRSNRAYFSDDSKRTRSTLNCLMHWNYEPKCFRYRNDEFMHTTSRDIVKLWIYACPLQKYWRHFADLSNLNKKENSSKYVGVIIQPDSVKEVQKWVGEIYYSVYEPILSTLIRS